MPGCTLAINGTSDIVASQLPALTKRHQNHFSTVTLSNIDSTLLFIPRSYITPCTNYEESEAAGHEIIKKYKKHAAILFFYTPCIYYYFRTIHLVRRSELDQLSSSLTESRISASATGVRGLMAHLKGTGYLLSKSQ